MRPYKMKSAKKTILDHADMERDGVTQCHHDYNQREFNHALSE